MAPSIDYSQAGARDRARRIFAGLGPHQRIVSAVENQGWDQNAGQLIAAVPSTGRRQPLAQRALGVIAPLEIQ